MGMTTGWGWPFASVRLRHLPTGVEVRVNEGSPSQHKLLIRARAMLRGKIWSIGRAPPPMVRTYAIPDDQTTIETLETGSCIDERARRHAARWRQQD